MSPDLEKICLNSQHTIRDAMLCLGQNSSRIVLIVDSEMRLLWTITDGDVRRAVLAGESLDVLVEELVKYKASQYVVPVTAKQGVAPSALKKIMLEQDIQQLPILDDVGRVVDLVYLEDLMPESALPMQAVIMAGGFGKRLRPLTENLPKPMLPIGGQPLMEHIITQLRQTGVKQVSVTTHFQPEKIIDYFGDGKKFGIELNYVSEDTPLGTAGSLSLMASPEQTVLVINGDILTRVDFRAMFDFHQENKADLTVGVRQYEFEVPYGVVESKDGFVRGLKEKPVYKFLVNAGIYLLAPKVFRYIPDQQRFDMTDLIELLLVKGHVVASFPIVEYWLDIGQIVDYKQAQTDFEASLDKDRG